jgi:hypothetical protein
VHKSLPTQGWLNYAHFVDANSLTAYTGALQAGWTPVTVATTYFGSVEFADRANATVG